MKNLFQNKKWIAGLAMIAVLLLRASIGWSLNCAPVTEASGTGPASLPIIASSGCSPIIFGPSVIQVTVPNPVSLKDNVVLNGAGNVTITGTVNASQAIFNLNKGNTRLENVTITHPGGLAVLVGGSSNRIKNCTIKDSNVGVRVVGGKYNLITQNSFTGITQIPIELIANGNSNLPAPWNLDAEMVTENTWELEGTVLAGTSAIEIYYTDDDTPSPPQGKTYIPVTADVSGSSFIATFNVDQYHHARTYALLATGSNNTSPFSASFKPTDDATDFFVNFPACRLDPANPTTDYFNDPVKGGWANDFDGGGDSNGKEDTNKNCVKDAGETDPRNAADDLGQDSDGDGVCEGLSVVPGVCTIAGPDNCPQTANADQTDTDGNGKGDECDPDIDGDGIPNNTPTGADNCPKIANNQDDMDGDKIGDACDDDRDGDGSVNEESVCPADSVIVFGDASAPAGTEANKICRVDNCPDAWNPEQDDSNDDGKGDACSDDSDGDRICDGPATAQNICVGSSDNCPTVPNPDQLDFDHDGKGNACDTDIDGDGKLDNDNEDNCPFVANPNQSDEDEDGFGDACEDDVDGDGVTDRLDNCPTVPNPTQGDLDVDESGDACDSDIDGDGIPNWLDNCPLVPNRNQIDSNDDGIGDECTATSPSTSPNSGETINTSGINIGGGGTGCSLSEGGSNAFSTIIITLSLIAFPFTIRNLWKKGERGDR